MDKITPATGPLSRPPAMMQQPLNDRFSTLVNAQETTTMPTHSKSPAPNQHSRQTKQHGTTQGRGGEPQTRRRRPARPALGLCLSILFTIPSTTLAINQTVAATQPQQNENVMERYEAKTWTAPDNQPLNYRWFIPESATKDAPVPLIILLHGAGERGADNQKQLVHGAKELVSDLVQSKQACALLVPQCPENEQWVDVPWSADAHELPQEPSASLSRVMALLKEIEQQQPIDSQRIYLIGLSMGGYGTWDWISRQGEQIAAAVPICGGGDSRPEVVKKIGSVPVWAFHGAEDNVVKPARSRNMVEALREAGAEPRYTEYEGVGHNSWTPTFNNPDLYLWLFQQSLKDRP